MNTTAHLNLLPASARFAIAVVVALVLALAWIAAERESHEAVIVAGNSLSSRITHVTLPSVEVVARRPSGKTNT
jgi:hypothetical protein